MLKELTSLIETVSLFTVFMIFLILRSDTSFQLMIALSLFIITLNVVSSNKTQEGDRYK